MNKLILITGDLAAGKSTFSKFLSQRYKITCYNKDDIKEILGDYFGFTNREENLKLSKCTFAIFKNITLKNIVSKNDLMLESNFRDYEMEYLNNLALDNNYKIITIVINADIKVLHKRFMNRILNENRHPVHKAVDFSNYSDFEKQIISDRNRNYKGEVIRLDSSNFEDLYNDNTIKEIDKYIIDKGV